MNEQLRSEVRDFVEDFGPPRPGLASLAVAGLPDRRARKGGQWVLAVGVILAIAAAGLLLWAGRSAYQRSVPATQPSATVVVPTPTATPRPTPQTNSVAGASAVVRATVTGAQPVLLPSAIVGAGWQAHVTTTSDSFLVTYTDPNGARTVTVGEGREHEPNPALPVARTTQTFPTFHGDRRSWYQVNDSGDPLSPRVLIWREPGTYDHTDPSYPGIPYSVSASGITDAEFWQLANSVR